MPRYVIYGLDGDNETPVMAVCPTSTDFGTALKGIVGVGNPYWVFETLSMDILTADPLAADFEGAPLCLDDEQENRNNVAGLYASPPPTGNVPGKKVWAG